MEPARQGKRAASVLLAIVLTTLLPSCSQQPKDSPERAQNAKVLFDSITRKVHVPSAAADGVERLRLQNEAASRYADLVKLFPEQSNVCAQALRSRGNIRASQTNIDAAVKEFAAVGQRYPTQEWEVLQAWKSAADLLWEAGRREEAKKFFTQIVTRYDKPEEPAIVKTIVRGSKAKLAE